jgi:hypothetical protein
VVSVCCEAFYTIEPNVACVNVACGCNACGCMANAFCANAHCQSLYLNETRNGASSPPVPHPRNHDDKNRILKIIVLYLNRHLRHHIRVVWVRQLAPALIILGELRIGEQCRVECRLDVSLLHAGADEHDLLPPVAILAVKVRQDDLALCASCWPVGVGYNRPPVALLPACTTFVIDIRACTSVGSV